MQTLKYSDLTLPKGVDDFTHPSGREEIEQFEEEEEDNSPEALEAKEMLKALSVRGEGGTFMKYILTKLNTIPS